MRPLFSLIALAGSLLCFTTISQADDFTIDVHRDAYCGCCKHWIQYLEKNGFQVNDHVEKDMAAFKTRLGVPHGMGSCHTGVINGQFVEGHVPAADIRQMLQKPDIAGIAVPGMPVGSPGMEVGDRQDAYDVIAIDSQGNAKVMTEYRP